MKKLAFLTVISTVVITAVTSAVITTVISIFSATAAHAQSVTIKSEVLPPHIGSMGWLNADQEGTLPTGAQIFPVNIQPKCFPSNLRKVAHPVRETSRLRLTLEFLDDGNTAHRVEINYPALLHFGGFPNELITTASPLPQNISVTCATCATQPRVFAYQGTLYALLRGVRQFPADPSTRTFAFPATGANVGNAANTVRVVDLVQIPAGTTQELMVSLKRRTEFGPDMKSVNMDLEVAGGAGFRHLNQNQVDNMLAQGLNLCFAFVSPLMLFFDNDLPRFTGNVRFRFAQDTDRSPYFWPEKGAKGYFLALDRNNNGRIDSGEELFGNNDSSSNGFHALREYDENKDGVIDEKDPIFSRLLLWRDVNSDGISQKSELFTLKSKGVKAIRLNYEKRVMKIGRRAEIRQSAKFEFVGKDGKAQEADIHDVWFAPGTP